MDMSPYNSSYLKQLGLYEKLKLKEHFLNSISPSGPRSRALDLATWKGANHNTLFQLNKKRNQLLLTKNLATNNYLELFSKHNDRRRDLRKAQAHHDKIYSKVLGYDIELKSKKQEFFNKLRQLTTCTNELSLAIIIQYYDTENVGTEVFKNYVNKLSPNKLELASKIVTLRRDIERIKRKCNDLSNERPNAYKKIIILKASCSATEQALEVARLTKARIGCKVEDYESQIMATKNLIKANKFLTSSLYKEFSKKKKSKTNGKRLLPHVFHTPKK